MVGHVVTPNDAAEMLRLVCGVAVSEADVQSVQVSDHAWNGGVLVVPERCIVGHAVILGFCPMPLL